MLELYCHQNAYVETIMQDCVPILVDNTRLPYGWEFSLNNQKNHSNVQKTDSDPHTDHARHKDNDYRSDDESQHHSKYNSGY